jgi:hypothetical protein
VARAWISAGAGVGIGIGRAAAWAKAELAPAAITQNNRASLSSASVAFDTNVVSFFGRNEI